MNNEVYRKIVLPAHDSEDGESPTIYIVTQENNGHAVWRTAWEGTDLKEFYVFPSSRDQAIDFAYEAAVNEIESITAKKESK